MPEVLFAYAIAALLVAIVFVIAFVLGRAFRGARPFLNLIGMLIVAIALLEKAGWSVRPWSLGSPAAAFNDLLFRILLLVGFGLLFVSWAATPGNRDPR
jgi:hypothetical protein